MKRKLFIICLAVALTLTVICCSACGGNDIAEQLRTINTLLSREYSETELEVTTETNGVTLNAEYEFVKSGENTNISYSIERLNGFDVNGSNVTAPSEFKTVVKGSAVFDGNAIISINGDDVEQQILVDIADTTLIFRMSYFDNVKTKKTVFTADVIDPQGFMQDDGFDGTDMNIKVVYNSTAISSIVINYAAANESAVTLSYTFTR